MDLTFAKPWVVFWVFVVCCHLYLDYSLFRKWKGWSRGLNPGFSLNVLKGATPKIWLSEVFLQRQLYSVSIPRWTIHQCIFWGFIALTILSMGKFILLLLSLISFDAGLHDYFSHGSGYHFTKLWGDFFGLILLAGCACSLIRRFVLRAPQIANDQTDTFLTAYLLFMTLSGFVLEGFRLSASPPDLARFAFMGKLFMLSDSEILSDINAWLKWTWIVHGFSGVAILAYLPNSKLMHSLLAPLIIAMNASEEHERKDMYWPKIKQYRSTK